VSTTLDQFQAAALALARAGSIKERLVEAYRKHLSLVPEDELPIELRDEFRTFNETLTREPPLFRGEDAVRATVRKMSCEQATEVASAVVRMYGALSRSFPNSARKHAKAPSNVVPLHLAEA
jgi:hypothetical protein